MEVETRATRREAIVERRRNRYQPIKERIFGNTDWAKLERESVGTTKATFQLDLPFNEAARFTAYDLTIDLMQVYSKPLMPVNLQNGCINLTLQFADSKDYLDRGFREIILNDPEYHQIFRAYDVTRIYLYGFPPEVEYHEERFKVDYSGIVTPLFQ